MSAESNIVYRKDIRNGSIKLLQVFRTRELEAEGCCRHHHRRRPEVGGGCTTLPSPPPPDQDLRLHHCRRHSLRWRSLLRLRPQPSWAAAAQLHHQNLRQGPGGCDSTATSGGGDGDCSVGTRLLSVLNIKLPCNPRLVCRCIPICRTDSRISNVQA